MVDAGHGQLSLRRQCALLGVTRSSLYYQHRGPVNESLLANEIMELWLEDVSGGYRKITKGLRRKGYEINHKRVLRMMRTMRIQAIYPKPRTTIPNNQHKKYPYLLRDLNITRPNQVWATDITYIKIAGGFVFLVAIIDIHSRFIISWSLSTTMEVDFCIQTLENALQQQVKPDILNTDQGVQFTSLAWVGLVEGNGIKVSMDGIGRWVDNVFIERFWRTLKYEHVLLYAFESVKEARKSIGQFIERYNYKRLHQSLGYQTPAEVYLAQTVH
jgi:putative transposase